MSDPHFTPRLWDDPEIHAEFHRLLIRNIRMDSARLQAEYDALPWYRKVFRRRPVHPLGGWDASGTQDGGSDVS